MLRDQSQKLPKRKSRRLYSLSKKEQSEEMGPASIFPVTLVPPYGEADNVVESNNQEIQGERGQNLYCPLSGREKN